jgi:hypothetical protein
MKDFELKKVNKPKYKSYPFSLREDKYEKVMEIGERKGMGFSEIMQQLVDALLKSENEKGGEQ